MYKYLMTPMVMSSYQTSQPFCSFDIFIMHDCRMFWLESSIPKVALNHALRLDKDYFDMYDDKYNSQILKIQLSNLLLTNRSIQKYSYPRFLDRHLSVDEILKFHEYLMGTYDLIFTKKSSHAELILLRNEIIAKRLFEKKEVKEEKPAAFIDRIKCDEFAVNAFFDMEEEVVKFDRLFIPEIGEMWVGYNEYDKPQIGVVLKNKFKKRIK